MPLCKREMVAIPSHTGKTIFTKLTSLRISSLLEYTLMKSNPELKPMTVSLTIFNSFFHTANNRHISSDHYVRGSVLSPLHVHIHLLILQISTVSWVSGTILDIMDTGANKTGKVPCPQRTYTTMGKDKQ